MIGKKPNGIVTVPPGNCEKCNRPLALKKVRIKDDQIKIKMICEKHELFFRLDPKKKEEWLKEAVNLFFRCDKCAKPMKHFRYWRRWEIGQDGSERELPNRTIIHLRGICLEHGPRKRKIQKQFFNEFVTIWQKGE